jgi:DNA-binding transcriptional ArsR family regulator
MHFAMPRRQPRPLDNSQLLKALSHPTRSLLLKALSERSETPKNLARELGRSIRHVEYHLGILEKLECVQLVKTDRTSGGKVIAHHYRAVEWLWLDRDSWQEVDPQEQPAVTMTILRSMSEDLSQALLAGTIDEGENHISRTPVVLDAAGYEQLITLLTDTLDRVVELEAESADRLEAGAEQITTTVHLVQFISPDPKDRGELSSS